MAGLQISCPRCGKSLKLPDRSLLGRKGKCPRCRHAFVLAEPTNQAVASSQPVAQETSLDVSELYEELDQIERRRQTTEPDEVTMEIVEPSARQPQIGTSPRWVPDPPAPGVAAAAGAVPAAPMVPPGYPYALPPQMPMPAQPWGTPPAYAPGYPLPAGMPYPVAPGYAPIPYGAPQYMPPPMAVPPQPVPAAPIPAAPPFALGTSAPAATETQNPFAAIQEAELAPSGPSELPSPSEMLAGSSLRKPMVKSKKSRQAQQAQRAAMIAVGVLVAAGIAFATLGGKTPKGKGKPVVQKTDEPSAGVEEGLVWESPLPVSPTKGAPVDVMLMPYGVSAVVHLRPAELWEKGGRREEFRYCWGPLGEWLEKQIKALCNHDPAQIEELTFGFIPGVVGEATQVCGVVRLKQPAQKTELIKLFREMKAELKDSDSSDYPVYESERYAYVIKDLRTFAFCPRLKQSEMAEAVNRPNAQSPGLEALLRNTDRLRHVVVIFDPTTLGAHAQFIFPAELHRLAERVVEFFDPKQIETVAWSLHIGDKFHSEILARHKSSVAKSTAQAELKKKLDRLPRELADTIRGYMDPKQVGPRQIIGRFPAMTKVYALATHASSGEKYVALTTALPERAAPNLAIGALLTWDESTRTDFTKAATPWGPAKESDSKLPNLVADRLKQLTCEIEFTKVPLQDGFKFIGDECKVTIDIDGDALKAAGFTKNMEQNMKLGRVSGLEAIAAILKRYEKERVPMVLVIDEAKKVALITTKEFADKDNLKTYPLP